MDVIKLKAILTVKSEHGLDDLFTVLGRSILLELVSSELKTGTGLEKERIQGHARKASQDGEEMKYEIDMSVPASFGEIGAVLVQNNLLKEIFLQDIIFKDGTGATVVTISCNSWVQPKSSDKRIFFTSKSYLLEETPRGLLELRKRELELKRGDGTGERKSSDRIYDYDVYNDLGEPDEIDKNRAVLGGTKEFPYPRRCRTGRPLSKKDSRFETVSSDQFYVPRDERFQKEKQEQFSSSTLAAGIRAVGPAVQNVLINANFASFRSIYDVYVDGFQIPKLGGLGYFKTLIPRFFDFIQDGSDKVFRFDLPEMIERDRFSWLRDEEFARETLAGTNPYAIELVKGLPLKSNLDPKVYGTSESAITEKIIEKQINYTMTAMEALKQKRLFMLNYHDLLLPYVHKVRALEGTTLYGSRTLFFLTDEGTLKPIAIELTRPPSDTKPEWRHVFVPSSGSTDLWLWRLAKAHVCAHDSAHHEVISHWLRTHCSVEPYIIAANRQLSVMHPIYRLLHPHFRYNMEINARARHGLINAGGIIEASFSPLQYSMELSSVYYNQFWRFDMEALPEDLIRRGMAEEDPTAEHGLKLAIADYPFANDGLLIWSAIKNWVRDYVSRYYSNSADVANDSELQSFWLDVRTKGHSDKKDEPWWPELNTQETLIQTLATIIWVASAHHAAVNFGQYNFGGYFPNRPTIARINMPIEDTSTPEEYEKFLRKPEDTLLECYPTQLQAAQVLATIEVLSSHSPDEEYLGDQSGGQVWLSDGVLKDAHDRFHANLKEIEGVIDGRNSDTSLKNRNGAGMVPYELMKPYSGVGLTGKGIPNSISI